MRLVPRFPAPNQRDPERLRSPPEWRFSRLGADRLPGRPSGTLMPRVRHRSEAVDVDRGQLVGRRLKDRPVVVRLRELAPVGGRAAGGREGRRLERFTQMREDLPDRPRIADRMSAATGGCQQCEGQGWFRTGKTV